MNIFSKCCSRTSNTREYPLPAQFDFHIFKNFLFFSLFHVVYFSIIVRSTQHLCEASASLFNSRVINAFYDLRTVVECENTKFNKNMTVKKWGTVLGSEWMNEEGRVVSRINLKPTAKVWVKFLKSRLMRTMVS